MNRLGHRRIINYLMNKSSIEKKKNFGQTITKFNDKSNRKEKQKNIYTITRTVKTETTTNRTPKKTRIDPVINSTKTVVR